MVGKLVTGGKGRTLGEREKIKLNKLFDQGGGNQPEDWEGVQEAERRAHKENPLGAKREGILFR